MREGFIKSVQLARDFAFIAINGGPDAFAHRMDFDREMEWDESLRGRRVVCDLERNDRGPQARNVKPAD